MLPSCSYEDSTTAPNPAQKQFKEDQRDLGRETKSSPCSAELKPWFELPACNSKKAKTHGRKGAPTRNPSAFAAHTLATLLGELDPALPERGPSAGHNDGLFC